MWQPDFQKCWPLRLPAVRFNRFASRSIKEEGIKTREGKWSKPCKLEQDTWQATTTFLPSNPFRDIRNYSLSKLFGPTDQSWKQQGYYSLVRGLALLQSHMQIRKKSQTEFWKETHFKYKRPSFLPINHSRPSNSVFYEDAHEENTKVYVISMVILQRKDNKFNLIKKLANMFIGMHVEVAKRSSSVWIQD